MAALLQAQALEAFYGDAQALFGIDFQLDAGELVAIIGANGAGKSTFLKCLTGLVRVQTDSVRWKGKPVGGMAPGKIVREGLAMVPEGRRLFASLSVEENLVLPFRQALGRKGVPEALERAYATFPRLGERRYQSAGTLSGGEQRMLALARVLVVRQKLLVVDELSFGLAPVMVDEVYAALGQVLSAGTSLLIIEQHVDRALHFADAVVVLSKGRVVYDGTVEGAESRLSELVLGRVEQ